MSCKGCTERHLNCHSTCKSYIDECKERERSKQVIRKNRMADIQLSSYIKERKDAHSRKSSNKSHFNYAMRG